jgi:Secretion system C-terminal sorting domain
MKTSFLSLVLFFTFISINHIVAQSSCGNLDFEDHHWTNWSGITGTNAGMNNPLTNQVSTIDSANGALSRHLLITTQGFDLNCLDSASAAQDTLMKTLYPYGGTASIRLGNDNTGAEAEALSYNLLVTDTFFCFSYAIVQQQPNHSNSDQPFFKVITKDALGNYIAGACDSFFVGQTGVPYIHAFNSIQYRRWSTICYNLGAYIGQQVQINFINADCALGGHFGYTYIDVSCISGGTLTAAVWPGDCNNDHVADMTDVVALGIANGATGPVRVGASTIWSAQTASDWSNSFPLGANYKHADSNGDGVVDLNDTTAILLNYSLTHPKPAAPQAGNPELMILPITNFILPGAFADFDVMLGTTGTPISSIYGLKFNLGLDTSKLDLSFTPQLTYTNSWLGITNVDVINIARHTNGESLINMGISKLNHSNVTGSGPIARLRVKSKSTLALGTKINVNLSSLQAFNNTFGEVALSTQDGFATVSNTNSLSVINNTVKALNLFPNPAAKELTIRVSNDQLVNVVIENLIGQVILNLSNLASIPNYTINLEAIPNGIYVAKVILASGEHMQKKLIVQH